MIAAIIISERSCTKVKIKTKDNNLTIKLGMATNDNLPIPWNNQTGETIELIADSAPINNKSLSISLCLRKVLKRKQQK